MRKERIRDLAHILYSKMQRRRRRKKRGPRWCRRKSLSDPQDHSAQRL
jgi:hypothetical protein